MSIKKISTLIMLIMICDSAMAGYKGNLKVNRFRAHGQYTYFGTSVQPANTCSNWGEYFRFDHTSADGKIFFSTLLAAKASDKAINIWYQDSSAVDTNQTNGCTELTIAVLSGIGLR